MTTITPSGLVGSEGIGNDLIDFNVQDFASGDLGTNHGFVANATEFTIYFEDAEDTFAVTFTGTGFDAPSGDNFPTTGTITGIKITDFTAPDTGAVLNATWESDDAPGTPIEITIATFRDWVTNNSTADFIDAFFGGEDTMEGTDDQDDFFGYGGDDQIRTYDGDDTAYGGDGDDYLIGDFGTDTLYGEAGDDVVFAFDGTAGDIYDGGSGDESSVGDILNALGIGDVDDDALVNLSAATLSNFEGLTLNRQTTDVDSFLLIMSGTQAQNAFSTTTAVTGSNDCVDYLWIQDVGGNLDISDWTFGTWNNADMVRIDGGAGGNSIIGASNQKNTLNGGGGADAIYGGSLSDDMYGSLVADGALDNMYGGDGGDRYAVLELNDNIQEQESHTGTDYAAVSVNNYTLADNVEAMALFGAALVASGNALGNSIQGNNTGNDTLSGLGGADFMYGQIGDDTLIGGAGADSLDGGAGTDTASYATSGSGVSVNLDSGVALLGDAAGDTFTLIESVLGSGFDDTLTGTVGANTLTGGNGNDTLNGNAGVDTLIGGGGNDTYVVDVAGDVITEALNGGTDTVQSLATRTLGANLENLTLLGTAALNGTGNTLANVLVGNSGANTLNGGAGIDSMFGGSGNDTYVVDNAGDTTTETATATGIDLVMSSVTRTLGARLENLTLTGAGVINGAGNTLANVITGNGKVNVLNGGAGADTLNGGLGNDTLTGGTGADKFVFNLAASTTNRDTITDFTHNSDTIQLDNAVFAALGGNAANLAATKFWIGANAHDANDRIVYNAANGQLFYDANGNAAGQKVLIAILDPGLALTASDFQVI